MSALVGRPVKLRALMIEEHFKDIAMSWTFGLETSLCHFQARISLDPPLTSKESALVKL